MFGTLSMICLVVCGAAGVNPLVIPALALANTLIGLPLQPVDTSTACRYNGLARVLPLQMVFCAIGYLLGAGFQHFTGMM